MDAKKRQAIRTELVSQGYSWDYVDSWPSKTILYAHRPQLNVEGKVAMARGTVIENQPGHPDHMARKSRIGMLPWPPSKECKCKACREEREEGVKSVQERETFTEFAERIQPASLVVSELEEKTTVMAVRGRPRGFKNKRRTATGQRTR